MMAAAKSIAEARLEAGGRAVPGAGPDVTEKTQDGRMGVPDETPKVEISNGAGRNKLAARMRQFLEGKGLPVSFLTNAASFDNDRTTIFYKPGQRAVAERFAGQLPIAVELVQSNANYADIRIRLGADILDFDKRVLYAAKMGEPNA
jgi:hypothetical protein